MASLYSKIIADPKKISLTDIFFSSGKKHTSADTDYALIAGTSLDTVHTEIGMLQKWEQPWLYRRVLLVGLLLSLSMIGAVGIMILLTGFCVYPALTLLMIMIPPCIVPIALMFFFWEMNAPEDIKALCQIITCSKKTARSTVSPVWLWARQWAPVSPLSKALSMPLSSFPSAGPCWEAMKFRPTSSSWISLLSGICCL